MSKSNINSLVCWAAISPPGKNGKRWIAHWSVALRKRDACAQFLEGQLQPLGFWRMRGWTIERVHLSPVLYADGE